MLLIHLWIDKSVDGSAKWFQYLTATLTARDVAHILFLPLDILVTLMFKANDPTLDPQPKALNNRDYKKFILNLTGSQR